MGHQFEKAMEARQLSANFSAANLCCVGATWQRTRLENEPQQAETWEALSALSQMILEPIREQYGDFEITYGFASPALMRQIPAHIAPKLDQHVCCERNTKGNLICPRRGAAVDFRAKDASSLDVAIWIAETLPFDRLYFYGADRPLHVSHGPDNTKGLIAMLDGPSGRRVPRKITLDWLKTYAALEP